MLGPGIYCTRGVSNIYVNVKLIPLIIEVRLIFHMRTLLKGYIWNYVIQNLPLGPLYKLVIHHGCQA